METRGVHRKGDYCTAACGHLTRPNIEASDNVFVDGIGWHRSGDQWAIHCCCAISCHGGQGVGNPGNDSVFVNGRAGCKIGDLISCGSTMRTGSTTVFCG